jgi:hypothetical protein
VFTGQPCGAQRGRMGGTSNLGTDHQYTPVQQSDVEEGSTQPAANTDVGRGCWSKLVATFKNDLVFVYCGGYKAELKDLIAKATEQDLDSSHPSVPTPPSSQ